jgi:hypothetical protein
MKSLHILFSLLLLHAALPAQNTFLSFTADTSNFANPDRGFYHFSEARASAYVPLDSATLVSWRTNEQITLVYRGFLLNSFVGTPISNSYLAAMQQDFNTLRATGMKCIVRFIYTDIGVAQAPYGDATKAQMLAHIQQLNPFLQANQDVIALVQAGFIGIWGEWYYTTFFGDPNAGPLTAVNFADRLEVTDSLLAAVPQRMVAIRTPGYKMNMLGLGINDTLTAALAYTSATQARMAYHNDCYLSSANDVGTFNSQAERDFLTAETRYVSYGGETCADNAFNDCSAALPVMQRDHLSYLHIDYVPTVITKWQTQGCLNDVKKKMGYRFEPVDIVNSAVCSIGDSFYVQLRICNSGWAAPFNERTFSLILRHTVTSQVFRVDDSTQDCRRWMAGDTTVITIHAGIGSTLPPGIYDVLVQLAEPFAATAANPAYSIRLAGNGVWESATGWNLLSQLIIVSAPPASPYAGTLWLGAPIITGLAPTHTPAITTFFNGHEVQINSNDALQYVTAYDLSGRAIDGSVTQTANGQLLWQPAGSFSGMLFLQVQTLSGKFTARVYIPQR